MAYAATVLSKSSVHDVLAHYFVHDVLALNNEEIGTEKR